MYQKPREENILSRRSSSVKGQAPGSPEATFPCFAGQPLLFLALSILHVHMLSLHLPQNLPVVNCPLQLQISLHLFFGRKLTSFYAV